jgi:mersacidin/lichenicidin family type 2 lantibiotic
MSNANIIRAWKDPVYRNSLSEKERAMLPENPAGMIELTDSQLEQASGGLRPSIVCTYVCTLTCTWGSKCPTSLCTLSIGTKCPSL